MFTCTKYATFLAAVTGALALSSTLQEITVDFGTNPTGVGMYIYQPTALAVPTPLIIASHYCGGTAQLYFSGTTLASLADTHGFIVVYPNAPTAGGCWDVATNATLTHNGGGDSIAIASIVRYAVANWGVDSTKVFATGTSSGAMMTSVLMGAYPDLFAAGSLYSGVPYGCFEGAYAWNTQCAEGELILTPAQWGALVFSGYPGYTGTRPRVQFWHGTADLTLYPQNFWEEIKQWTDVFGVSQTPVTNLTDNPLPGYSRASFGPNIQGILAQGVGHTVPEIETDTLDWFGLSSLTPTQPSSTSTTTATSSGTPTATVAEYGQCGGVGYTGSTICAAPYKCELASIYFSQCL
ncbi:carbohydrate-binding module family 1 protein [Athelia psychrophila]|uniref:Carboxylic ester hydrolase n=1 Tax=Athelia psychrophila TaxID=1759441 RepID=A0A166WF44_9AGAM|nr:carbohydrate-binding module family 1 protein [Fibularhizoctonia sp. CBS 109695]